MADEIGLPVRDEWRQLSEFLLNKFFGLGQFFMMCLVNFAIQAR